MEELTGSDPFVFLGMTVALFGLGAFLTGEAIAQTWRSPWQLVAYALLLAGGDRFLQFALFDAELLAPLGYLLDVLVLLAIAWASWRLTLARLMVVQYPWLYERSGLFTWRARA